MRVRILKLFRRFRDAPRAIEALAEHEQWPRSEITELQLGKINHIWDHAITHVPYYRKLFRDRNLPRQFQSLGEYASSVPLLDKATAGSGLLLSERPRPGHWYHTGGSTGIPLMVYRENETDLEMVWSQYRSRVIWDVGVFDKRALLWGHATSLNPGLGHKLRQFSNDLMLNRVHFSAYKLGNADLQRYLARITEFKPVQLYGYSTATYLLAVEALRSGFTKPDSLRLVTLTSERATKAIREAVHRAFETNVTEEYGAAECLIIAYEDRQHLLRIREDNVMVETLPIGDGYYKIVISVLCNPSFPLLRYDIGDLTEKPVTETNVGFGLLGPVFGRANDFLISASGKRVHEGVLDGLYHYPIRCFRAHQFSNGKVLLLLEVGSATNIDPANIQEKVTALLDGQEVEVRLTESIPPTSSGKHKWITSDITNPDSLARLQDATTSAE